MNLHRLSCLRRPAGVCVAVSLALPAVVMACGACDEDSVAATYDHQVVEQAARAHDLIVYCKLDGRVDRQIVLRAVRRVPGLRAQSIRISEQPPALSFAVDARRQSARTAVAAAQLGLPRQSQLLILKVTTNGAIERAPMP